MKQADANPSNDSKANPDSKDVATAKKPRSFAKSAIAFFTILSSCSLLTFSGDTKVRAQAATTPGIAAPATRRITAELVSPTAAFQYYGTSTTHTNGPGHWPNYAPEIRALARGLGGNRLPVAEYTQNVAKYVRDNIEMEFRFGLGKGARGAAIDQSGTAFDQAELMVKLMRAGGHTASFNVGTITLNKEQFGKWTGLVTNLNEANQTFTVNANAACRFLADGGIPATVNGASSCASVSGDLVSVTMAHVWVTANGTTYDPAYKIHKLYAGIDIPAAMGCGTRANPTCGSQIVQAGLQGATKGEIGGAKTIKNVNHSAIYSKLVGQTQELQTSLQSATSPKTLDEAMGALEITTSAPLSGQAGDTVSRSLTTSFSEVPDFYRAALRVQFGTLDRRFFADELSGRRLQVNPQSRSKRLEPSITGAPFASILLDGNEIAAQSLPISQDSTHIKVPVSAAVPTTAVLTVEHPNASAANRLALNKSSSFILAFSLFPEGASEITQLPQNGSTRDDWQFRRNGLVVLQMGSIKSGAGPSNLNDRIADLFCSISCDSTKTDRLASSYLQQASSVSQMISAVSQARVNNHHVVGVISEDFSQRSWFNLSSSYSVTSRDSINNKERAAAKTFANLLAFLEGSVSQQSSDSGDDSSAFSMMYWSKSWAKFVLFEPSNASSAIAALNLDQESISNITQGSALGSSFLLPISDSGSAGIGHTILGVPISEYNQFASPTSGLLLRPQLRFSEEEFAATLGWAVKGGGSSTEITPLRAHPRIKQPTAPSPLGTTDSSSGVFSVDVPNELVVGTGASALSFSRRYSSDPAQYPESDGSVSYGRVFNIDNSGTVTAPAVSGYNDEVAYESGDTSTRARLTGGWSHSFQERAQFSNSGRAILNPNIARDAVAALVATQVLVDVELALNVESLVASVFVINWFSDQFISNVLTINNGTTSKSFTRAVDGGNYVNSSNLAEVATVNLSRSRVNICDREKSVSGPTNSSTNYAGTTISIRDRSGTTTVYEPGAKTHHTSTECAFKVPAVYIAGDGPVYISDDYEFTNNIFVPETQSRADGITLTYEYEVASIQSSNSSEPQNCKTSFTSYYPYGCKPAQSTQDSRTEKILLKVSTNLGTFLEFKYVGRLDSASYGVSANSSKQSSYKKLSEVISSDGRKILFDWESQCAIANLSNGNRPKVCNLLTVTRPDNSVLKYDYTPGVDSPQATDPTYRPRYLLRRWYSPSDQTNPAQSVRYDELGRVASVTTKNSQGSTSTSNVYVGGVYSGENERRVEQVDAAGGRNLAFYDDRGNAVRTVNEVGTQQRFEYDGLGRVVTAYMEEAPGSSYKTPVGGSTSNCMGPSSSKVLCWRTEYEYDERGNVTKETKYPYLYEGDFWWGQIEVTEAAYSTDFNKPLWVRGPYAHNATVADRDVRKTSYEYDSRGLLTKMTQPVAYDHRKYAYLAPVTEYEYDQFGRILLEKGPSGVWTRTAYGEGGQAIWCPTSVTKSAQSGGLNLKSSSTCTTAGDVATATDAKGNTTTFTYDVMRRKTEEAAPLSVKKRWIYDLDGNVTTEGAWDGSVWKDMVSTYSPTGKALTQTDPAGDQVKFDYDLLDRVSIKTDPEGRQVLTCYNGASQVLEEWRGRALATSQCGTVVSQGSASAPQRYVKNVYGGPNGAITEMYDPNNNKTVYGYQGHGRKVTSLWPDGKLEYHYRNETYATGPVNGAYDRQGRVSYVYEDTLKRPYVTYWMDDDLNWTALSVNYYDSAGNKTWSSDVNYANGRYKTARFWEYDTADRVHQEWTYYSFPMDAAGNITNWNADASILGYSYDANGNRTQMRYFRGDLADYGYKADYSYDPLNRMTNIAFGPWIGALHGNVAYDYDTLGRRTKITRSNGTRTDYAYETDSDLDWMRDMFQGGATASAANDTWMGIDYGYDKSGRLTLMSATDSRIMGSMPEVGSYGAANNLNQVASVPGRASAMTWSDAGNMKTDGKGTTFTHDGRQKLVKAVKSDGTTIHNHYNTDGLRIESIKNPTGVSAQTNMPTGGTRVRYQLSGTEEVADFDGGRNLLRLYVPGAAIDERVAQIDANNALTFIHNDRQNSVIAISDASGNVSSRRAYGTYGETDPAQMVSINAHPFGYTGRRWDPDLGLYYYRARWYDPQLGTFLQTDPIGSLDYINLYSYVGLEPGNGTDPSGMQVYLGTGGFDVKNMTPEQKNKSANDTFIAGNVVVAGVTRGAYTAVTAVVPKKVVISFLLRGVAEGNKLANGTPELPPSVPTAVSPTKPPSASGPPSPIRPAQTPKSDPKPTAAAPPPPPPPPPRLRLRD